MVRSNSLSVTFCGRSRRIGFPHLAHLGPAASRFRSTRFGAEQKGHCTITVRVASVVLAIYSLAGVRHAPMRAPMSKLSLAEVHGKCKAPERRGCAAAWITSDHLHRQEQQ